MRFIRSSLLKDHTTATEVKILDLPVNPVSHLIIGFAVFNATDEATLAEIIAFINKVTVTWNGISIVDLESEDLFALDTYLYRRTPVLTSNVATDNEPRTLGLIVPFGRKTFDPDECFPATKKGELQLHLDTTVPATSADNGIVNVEAVELVGANPSRYMKSVVKTVSAPGATGDNDVDLPIGNDIAAMLIWNTTFPAAASHTYGVAGVSVLVDNVEYGYAYAKANGLIADGIFYTDASNRDIAAFGQIHPDNYMFVDYDPNRDGRFLLETAGKSSVVLRLDMGVDEASRVTTVELVDTSALSLG